MRWLQSQVERRYVAIVKIANGECQELSMDRKTKLLQVCVSLSIILIGYKKCRESILSFAIPTCVTTPFNEDGNCICASHTHDFKP